MMADDNDDADREDLPPEEPPHSSGRYKGNNQGGYGNPPIRSQFGRGNPGGPSRRRGATSMDTALRKMFRSTVIVTKGGQPLKLDMAEAMAERVRKEILSGNVKALELGFQLLAKYGPTGEENMAPAFDFSVMTYEQKRALRLFLGTIPQMDRHEWSKERREARAAGKKKRGR